MTVRAAPQSTDETAVRVRGLTYHYPGESRAVLNGLDLDVAVGERVALLGPNGSGKTTFVLHLNGLIETQQGEIVVDGIALHPTDQAREAVKQIRRQLGMVFQHADDQLFMPTVHDDVAFGPANLGLDRDQREKAVTDALAAVHASDLADRVPHHLSGGEKRRAAIATVLAMDPSILVLDEPTSGLDPLGRRELGELLLSLPHTQLIVTHDLPFALMTCPRSIIIDGGRVVADAPTSDLLRDTDLLHRHRLELPFGYRN